MSFSSGQNERRVAIMQEQRRHVRLIALVTRSRIKKRATYLEAKKWLSEWYTLNPLEQNALTGFLLATVFLVKRE